MFEQNNVGIRCDSALGVWLADVAVQRPDEFASSFAPSLQRLAEEQENEEGEEEEGEWEDCDDDDESCESGCGSSGCGDDPEAEDESVAAAEGGDLAVEPTKVDLPAMLRGGSLLRPLDGTALFSTICIMNHCCAPNVSVIYAPARAPKCWSAAAAAAAPAAASSSSPSVASSTDSSAIATDAASSTELSVGIDSPSNPASSNESASASSVVSAPEPVEPLWAQVVALRDIAPGEELCFSYIAAELPPDKRKRALLDYDVVCDCELCRQSS